MAGLTAAGLEIKRLADLNTDITDAIVATFGPTTQVGPDSVFGQLAGVFAIELALVWELAQQLYDSFDPDQAEGSQLDNLAAIVGVSRLPATYSTGIVTLTGTEGTVVPEGTIFATAADVRFETIADVTIGATPTAASIRGTVTGPLAALAGTITTIITPVAGLDSVTNAADITEGRNVETDEELRIRREASLQITGAAVDQAIRSALLAIPGVEQALVISNRTALTVDGIPPHAFRSVIWPDPSDAAFNATIAETIFGLQPAGIQAFGTVLHTVTDETGYSQTVGFDFATPVTIIILCSITKTTGYPADGDAQVAAALLAEGQTLSVGDDVKYWKFIAALDPIPGIVNVAITINGGTANIPISPTQIASFSSGNITVTS